MTKSEITASFRRRYGGEPAIVVRAPGRVNLIGEHTDYNDGFVLPVAIDRAVWIALRRRGDRRVSIYSTNYDATADFDLDHLEHTDEGWAEYAKGTAWGLQEAGFRLSGWEGVMGGDVPRGAGLSSSAAVELAVARAFAAIGGIPWNAKEMALLGQHVENNWVGVDCGIMDQMIIAAGREGAALLLDCRSLELRFSPLPPEAAIVIMDTGTRRGLVASAYNERRRQCEEAAAFFGVPALRDVDVDRFEAESGGLSNVTRRRARHVVTENERTLAAVEAMEQDDLVRLGHLMNASHESLRDDFEVSSPALDIMVEIARRQDECYGARMTGAGFGGCAVALVTAESNSSFATAVASEYRRHTPHEPQVYVCSPAAGAEVVRA